MFKFLKTGVDKIKGALNKTRSFLSSRLQSLFSKPWTEETFEELEEILYEADLGSECAASFVAHLRKTLKDSPTEDKKEILKIFHSYALEQLKKLPPSPLSSSSHRPHVILIVGVNGSGKTTSIAKLCHRLKKEGKKVLLVAGDTFRAAAIEQLCIWAERLEVEIVKSKSGADPSSVAFDGLSAAVARNKDVVIIDTAGRLQNKTDLMQELEKIKRVCHKVVPDAPHETLLVLDATTGQNAIDQAKIFHQVTPLSGIILTKLDGSAKGGIVLSICQHLFIPVLWIGTGEAIEDLDPFDPKAYVDSLFEFSI